MKKNIIFAGLILILVFVAGCSSSSKPPVKPEPMFQEFYLIHGTLRSIENEGNISMLVIDYDLFNCEKNISSITISANMNPSGKTNFELINEEVLVAGREYLFHFIKTGKDDEFGGYIDSSHLEACQNRHNGDIYIDMEGYILNQDKEISTISTASSSAQATAVQVRQNVITKGSPTEIKTWLVNRQDFDIPYKIIDAKIVDQILAEPFKNAWQEPHYAERLKNAFVSACTVEYPAGERVIKAHSTEEITLTVTCNEPITCVNSYRSCDINHQNCIKRTLDECEFYLWGSMWFKDELGFEHQIPSDENDYGFLKQEIRIR